VIPIHRLSMSISGTYGASLPAVPSSLPKHPNFTKGATRESLGTCYGSGYSPAVASTFKPTRTEKVGADDSYRLSSQRPTRSFNQPDFYRTSASQVGNFHAMGVADHAHGAAALGFYYSAERVLDAAQKEGSKVYVEKTGAGIHAGMFSDPVPPSAKLPVADVKNYLFQSLVQRSSEGYPS